MKGKIYGYCRVSTNKQKIERQIDNIKAEYPTAIIITEDGVSGCTTDRPAWNKLKDKLKAGDTVVFDEVSRMSRNAAEGFLLYRELFDAGVNLIFLKEHHIDSDVFQKAINSKVSLTDTSIDCIIEGINEYLMILARQQIEIAFQTAQQEVDYLHQRTSEGVQKALERYDMEEIKGIAHEKGRPGRMKGKKIITKKEKALKALILEHNKDFDGDLCDAKTMALINGMHEIKTSRDFLVFYRMELSLLIKRS